MLPRLVVAALLLGPADGVLSRQPKRHRSVSLPSAADVLVKAAELLHITTPPFVFHSDDPSSRTQLIDALWAGTWVETVARRFTDANPAMTQLLELQMVDDSDTSTRFRDVQGQSRWEAVMSALFRARSQRLVPVEIAAMSVMWLYYKVPQPIWRATCYFGRSIMSSAWAEELCDLAMQRDPGPTYKIVEGLTAAVFDNLSMQVEYRLSIRALQQEVRLATGLK